MINLLDTNSYWAYWYGVRKSHPTDRDAYEAVELELVQLYGCGIYENYDSWRVAKHRYIHTTAKKLTNGDISKNTLSDILTIPGYMKEYDAYKDRKMHRSPTLWEQEQHITEQEIWTSYNHHIKSMYGVEMYTSFGTFRQARSRYIQSLRKRKYVPYKEKVVKRRYNKSK
jgi:hypothetical protein